MSGLSEIYIIQLKHNKFIIYAPLKRAAFVCNQSAVNLINDFNNQKISYKSFNNNEVGKFLKRLGLLDHNNINLPGSKKYGLPQPTSITLFLTNSCNLYCSYCYASAGERPVESMKFDVAKRGIDFIIENAFKLDKKQVDINFHGGGEPTLNWKILVEAYNYAKKISEHHEIELKSYIATNGMLSCDKIEWITRNITGTSVSYDGLPKVQDANRKTKFGHASSDNVIKSLVQFDSSNYNYSIRVTVTKDENLLLPESIEYICRNFNPKKIQIEPAYLMGRHENGVSADSKEFINMFRLAKSIAKNFNMDITISTATLGRISNHFCGVSQDSFSLAPSGNVSACYEVFNEDCDWAEIFFYGRPSISSHGYIFDMKRINHLRNQQVGNREYCQNCFAKWSCAGDCYHKSLVEVGNGIFQGSNRCQITQELTKDLILEKIINSGGLFWHEPNSRSGSFSEGFVFADMIRV